MLFAAGDIGLGELLVPMVILALVGFAGARSFLPFGSSGPVLVLRQFWVSRTPNNGYYIVAVGRPTGFWSWVRSLFGMHREIQFDVSSRGVTRTTTATAATLVEFAPLQNIGSCRSGTSKNLSRLFAAAALFVFAIALFSAASSDRGSSFPAVVGAILVLAAIATAISYFFTNRLEIAVETGGGRMLGIFFKPGVIENVHFDAKDLREVMSILQSLTAQPRA